MADGDLIYVPTASDGIGYKLGGSALAYKATAPVYGLTVAWTSGPIWEKMGVLYLDGTEPSGSLKVFESPMTCDDGIRYNYPFGWQRWKSEIGGLTHQWGESVACGWDPDDSQVEMWWNQGSQSKYQYNGGGDTPPSGTQGAWIGTYTWLSGFDLGTVTVSA